MICNMLSHIFRIFKGEFHTTKYVSTTAAKVEQNLHIVEVRENVPLTCYLEWSGLK